MVYSDYQLPQGLHYIANRLDCSTESIANELIAAVSQTPSIPPLQLPQLLQVLYHCQDIQGNLTSNSFCVNGCAATPRLLQHDQCQSEGNGTAMVTVTTTRTETVSCASTCIQVCKAWCIGGNCTVTKRETLCPGLNRPFHRLRFEAMKKMVPRKKRRENRISSVVSAK